MIAVDTNVLARLLLKDDDKQYRAAVDLFARNASYTAPPTVILELVWVLETKGCRREEITRALRLLFGLTNFKPEAAVALGYAVTWFEAGMDFADALHLALSADHQGFASFDKALGKQSRKLATTPLVTVVGAD